MRAGDLVYYYANARTYSLQAAADLYGAGSNEVTQVTNTCNIVGVGGGTSAAGIIAAATSIANPYRSVLIRQPTGLR